MSALFTRGGGAEPCEARRDAARGRENRAGMDRVGAVPGVALLIGATFFVSAGRKIYIYIYIEDRVFDPPSKVSDT